MYSCSLIFFFYKCRNITNNLVLIFSQFVGRIRRIAVLMWLIEQNY